MITKVEWSVRRSKLAEEDNCCGVVEGEEQHAGHVDGEEGGRVDGEEGGRVDGKEGGQQLADQIDGELLTADQVHSRLHDDLADCQPTGGGGKSEDARREI